jgi:4-amino-4-deoxy-L-arabinose transferase-like glycosyltransferase
VSLRAVWLVLAIGSGLGALFPEVALFPIAQTIANMRAPETAPSLARGLFGAAAIVFGATCVAWAPIRARARRAIEWIVDAPDRTFRRLVVVTALLPRALVAGTIAYEPTADALWYHEAAMSLAADRGFAVGGELTAYRPPGWPFLLSLAYRLFGPHVGLAWLWGFLWIAIILVAIHFVARTLYGTPVARLATLAAATYPALVLMTGQPLSDLPFVAGLLVLVACVLVDRPWGLAASAGVGAAIGLLTLTRSAGLGLLVVVPALWLLRGRAGARVGASALLVVIAFGACIAPWVLRNDAVFGRPTLGTNLGANLYIGNHRGASGGSVAAAPAILPDAIGDDEAEVDAALTRRAVDFVVSAPGEAAALLPGKLVHLYLLDAYAVSALFQGERPSPAWVKYGLFAATQLAYVAFLSLLVVRAFELLAPARRPRGVQWTGWLLAGYFTLLCLVFHGEDRYRLPILPWILIEGCVVLARSAGPRSRS